MHHRIRRPRIGRNTEVYVLSAGRAGGEDDQRPSGRQMAQETGKRGQPVCGMAKAGACADAAQKDRRKYCAPSRKAFGFGHEYIMTL